MILSGINCMQSKIKQNGKINTLCYVKHNKDNNEIVSVCMCFVGFLCVYCIYTALLFKRNTLPLIISNKDIHFLDNYL